MIELIAIIALLIAVYFQHCTTEHLCDAVASLRADIAIMKDRDAKMIREIVTAGEVYVQVGRNEKVEAVEIPPAGKNLFTSP